MNPEGHAPGTTRDDRTDVGDWLRGAPPASRGGLAPGPGMAWGRYRLEGLLGEGGSGRACP